jgi:hypothetical protein
MSEELSAGRERPARAAAPMIDLVERQPDDLARTVAAVAVRRLGKGVGQLPFLRFVAPLGGRMRDDVVRVAVRAHGCRSRGSDRSPIDVLGRLLFRMKGIEK